MKKILLSAVMATSIMTNTANADFLGAEAGYAVWQPTIDGNLRNGNHTINFNDNLGFGDKENNSFIWAYFDHFIPLIPNAKVQKTNYSATSTIDNKELTLNQIDMIVYYRILDNWVNLDIGLMIKDIAGNFKTDNGDIDFDISIPMVYAKARLDLPFTGLSVEADLSKVSFRGNSISDIKAGIVYESSFGLGATLGLRKENLVIDDIDGTYGTIDIEGVYAGLFYHF
jgi:outer membrane protein